MSKGYRRSLFILSASILLMFAVSASAQQMCDECDPYNSYCSDTCLRCHGFTQDGGCLSYTYSTCGGTFGNGPCIPDDCTPSWSETSRVTQGTYDGNSWFDCDHHSVQWVTLYDANQCNRDSDFWTQHYCDNVIDGHKSGYSPDCCDGYGPDGQPNSLYTCNGYHSCTG